VAVIKGSQFLITRQLTIDRPALAAGKASRKPKEKGIDKMSKREINAAVASTRKALATKNSKQPAK
jgi:hypothetical protein